MNQISLGTVTKRKRYTRITLLSKSIKKNWDLYLLITPVIVYFIIFHYVPMYGVQIAFKNFIGTRGIWGSQWVGLAHFERFFTSYNFIYIMKNTLGISLYQLAVGFPIPIILALLMNELKNGALKRTVQIITYAPHFISTIVLVGILVTFLSPSSGMINQVIKALGGEAKYFIGDPVWFKTLYVLSGVWQQAGWGSIIYMAALAGIDPQLHEAAITDGASRLKRIWHINIPGIAPTMIILLILEIGQMMNVGFEKVFLMQNTLNVSTSEIITTYVYKTGLLGAQYSFSAAVGLFNSAINLLLLLTVNSISRRVSETSLW